MAGKQSSPLCLHSSSYLTMLMLSCLLAASSSASLPPKPPTQRPPTQTPPTQLEVDDIGVYFKWIVEAANPEPSTLSVELKDTTFDSLVCPLFGIYSRFYTALQSLSEEDPRHRNVSVLVFVTERHAGSLCEDVKANCTDEQECSRMSCSISSIAQPCLHLPSLESQMEALWGPNQAKARSNDDLIPLWLGRLLANGYPDEDILDTVVGAVERSGLVDCTITDDGNIAQISIACRFEF